MHLIKLDDHQQFAVEHLPKKVRLILYNNGVENVCRMETARNIRHFVLSHQEIIFKGRPQLHKNAIGIEIKVKGKLVGIIGVRGFFDALDISDNIDIMQKKAAAACAISLLGGV
jgi:hypothetical protein